MISLKLGSVKSNSQTVSKVLNIKLSPGELSILMGRNAAGKSTLVSALTAAGKFEVSGRGHFRSSDFRSSAFVQPFRTSVREDPARFNILLRSTLRRTSQPSAELPHILAKFPPLTFGTWQSRKLLPPLSAG
ncbi:MAG: ATP-binding cassette domain-containing protein [Candidatus Hodgkinia cicadicola]